MKHENLSIDQQTAVEHLADWFKACEDGSNAPTFKLAGYAGTGKTTLLSYLCGHIDEPDRICVMAYTGKAVSVLKRKGIRGARTIHSTIYNVQEGEYPTFWLKSRQDFRDAKLFIVDEGSMVNRKIADDLASFGVPTLYVGDGGQLEPVGEDHNPMADADFTLTKIHRQAERNPILRAATAFREDRPVPNGTWQNEEGGLTVADYGDYMEHLNSRTWSQVIVGYNRTRKNLNMRVRERLYGDEAKKLLLVGERLICLDNNHDSGFLNGQQATVVEIESVFDKTLRVTLRDDDGNLQAGVPILKDQFRLAAENPITKRRAEVCLFDYAYVITCHKAQGSEYDDVLVMEQGHSDWDMRRWRYTAATRAAKNLTYCRGA